MALNNEPPAPRYSHTAEELRWVADLLDVLNRKPSDSSVGFDGELRVCWFDRLMGIIGLDDPEDFATWAYWPAASTVFETEDETAGLE